MPALYEKIRDAYSKKGVGYNRAQAIAAATYNKMRQTHPDMQKLSNKPEATKIKVKK